jgi:hypothetical protein
VSKGQRDRKARERRAKAANVRRALLCTLLVAFLVFVFDLWRGPMPDSVGSFAMGALLTVLGVLGIWVGLRPPEVEQRDVPSSYLAYDRFRFLWLGLGLSVVAVGAYLFDDPPGGRSGGSWFGYTLGTLAFAAMLWLMWFGVRKRSYASRGAPLRAWLSAHVYLGLALLVVMPLHSAFQFGWNVHTLAMVLAALAIFTGVSGLAFYGRTPTRITRHRPGQKLVGLGEQVADLDLRCRTAAATRPDELATAIEEGIRNTRLGGGPLILLRGFRPEATIAAKQRIESAKALEGPAADRAQQLVEMLAVKERLLERIARDARYMALLDGWLLLHVPIAAASVVAVAVHVFVVFYYR